MRDNKFKKETCPAKVFGYLGLCRNVKAEKIQNKEIGNVDCSTKLPLLSLILNKYSVYSVVKVNWSFLGY